MPTKKELENTIRVLRIQNSDLKARINVLENHIDNFEGTSSQSIQQEIRTSDFKNWERCLLRDAEMRRHFYDLLDKEEDPYRYGILKPLRYQTYEWALEKGYFSNLKKPLSYKQLTYILPKPKKQH